MGGAVARTTHPSQLLFAATQPRSKFFLFRPWRPWLHGSVALEVEADLHPSRPGLFGPALGMCRPMPRASRTPHVWEQAIVQKRHSGWRIAGDHRIAVLIAELQDSLRIRDQRIGRTLGACGQRDDQQDRHQKKACHHDNPPKSTQRPRSPHRSVCKGSILPKILDNIEHL